MDIETVRATFLAQHMHANLVSSLACTCTSMASTSTSKHAFNGVSIPVDEV